MHTLVHEQDIRDEGIAIGREEGIQQEMFTIVQRLIQRNYPDSEIMEITGCKQELIEKAKKE